MTRNIFDHVGSLSGKDDAFLTGLSDLHLSQDAGRPVLYTTSGPGGGGIAAYALDAEAADPAAQFAALGRVSLPGLPAAGRPALFEPGAIGGQQTAFVTGAGTAGLWAVGLNAQGRFADGGGALAGAAGLPPDLVVAHALRIGGTDFLYATRLGSETVSVWRVDAASGAAPSSSATGAMPTQEARLTAVAVPEPDAAPATGAGLSALASVTLGGTTFLLAASQRDTALVAHRIEPDGRVTETARIGAAEGLGIADPAALATVLLNGKAFVVMASAGSGTLSVAEVGADGSLTITDHVMDDLGTRFQGARLVETIVIGDAAYVVTAGADDGISLFRLLPDGMLLHLGSLADATGTTLDNVSGLALFSRTVDGIDTLEILVSSASEPGVSWLRVALGAPGVTTEATPGGQRLNGTAERDTLLGGAGNDRLFGGAGDDILYDGAGGDVLTGGDGADTFVLAADGGVERIADFDPLRDRIDLSAWQLLRHVSQLDIRESADRTTIRYRDEVLHISTKDGTPLTAAQIANLDLLGLSRLLPSWLGPLEHPDPNPPPRPRPDPYDPDDAPERPAATPGYEPPTARTILGTDGVDALAGDERGDLIEGRGGDDRIRGGAGGDLLFGSAGADGIWGDEGTDWIFGGGGADEIAGGTGWDVVSGEEDADLLRGDGGHDTLYGGQAADALHGGRGNDLLDGGGSDDSLYGGIGTDSLLGSAGSDLLHGDEGADLLLGEDGDDRLYGGAGPDALHGGAGDDSLEGGINADRLYGGLGADALEGGRGHDMLYGGAGNDRLAGGSGNDWIDGGEGDDVLTGGIGADSFVFRSGGGSATVTDFQPKVDRLVLDPLLWGGGARDPSDVIAAAEVTAEGLLFDFGSARLRIENVTDPALLQGRIEFM